MLYDEIGLINHQLTAHSGQVDELEMALLEVHRGRKERKKKQEMAIEEAEGQAPESAALRRNTSLASGEAPKSLSLSRSFVEKR